MHAQTKKELNTLESNPEDVRVLHALTIDVDHTVDPLSAAAEAASRRTLPDPSDEQVRSASQAAALLTSVSSSMRMSRFNMKLKAKRDASASVFELDGRLTHAPFLRPTDPLRYQVTARSTSVEHNSPLPCARAAGCSFSPRMHD